MPYLGIHITNDGIFTSEGDRIIEPPFLDFLITSYPNYQKVFYDLDVAVASLCKLLGLNKEQCQRFLYGTEKSKAKGKLYIPPYHLTYFQRYYFSIDYGAWEGHPSAVFSNMNQVGYLSAQYTQDNSPKDALGKASQAKDTAIRIYHAFEAIGLDTTSISSPIAAFLKKQQFDWPTEEDCPEEATILSWRAIKGHWFEIFSMGLFPNAYLYDINGSYNNELSKLPDIRLGTFSKDKVPPDKTMLGIAEGTLKTDAEFHPFLIKIGKNNHTPKGVMPTMLSFQEIQFLKRWQLGDFHIENGHWWQPTELKFPYRGLLIWLWNKKRASQDQTIRDIITRLYASLWGLQSQYLPEKEQFGDYFNSFINYTVESNSRLHVTETCIQYHQVPPLAIVGDGFISDKELSLALSTDLGGWKLTKHGKCLIAGSGAIAFQNDKPPIGLALHYDTLIEQMKSKPKAIQYPRTKYSPTTLAIALQRNFNKLGTIQKVERNLLVGNDTKRIYFERPQTGEDLLSGNVYQSLPWPYNMLEFMADKIKSYEKNDE